MGAFIFAFGGLCFVGLVLFCGAYFTSRMHARWDKEIKRTSKQLEESILEYIHIKKKLDAEKKQCNAKFKNEGA